MKVSDFWLLDPEHQLQCISWHETSISFPFLCKISPAARPHSPQLYKLYNIGRPYICNFHPVDECALTVVPQLFIF